MSTVSCACTRKEPYPGYFLYDVTVTFDYTPSGGGLRLQTSPPPFAQTLSASGTVIASGPMTPSGTSYIATFSNQSACPANSKVLFREEQINPTDVDSTGCPCANCRSTTTASEKSDDQDKRAKKKKKK